jgi:uncharacterized repeat protein (TIGR01451 family)
LIPIALALCASACSGCIYFQTPRLDPSGEPLYTQPPAAPGPAYRVEPGRPPAPNDLIAVTLRPRQTVAPVGSVVVLVAGVLAGDGYLRTNERLEWSIAPCSVGQFIAVQHNGWVDLLLGDFNQPHKVNNTFAIGSTSREYVRLSGGMPGPAANLCVLRGEGWVSLTSPMEGTSHVAVYAPGVVPWNCRVQEAMIYWIDAQFGYPPPSNNPAGSRHVLCTTVLRQSNQAPHVGWVVRYEIVGGPPAGFAPDGATAAEVMTNAAGQAAVEIFEKQPAHGTNTICIRVFRPAGAEGPRLLVNSGSTLKTWTAADIGVRQTGPAEAAVGTAVTYHVEVFNPGDMPARDVMLSEETPDGFTYLTSNPPAEVAGKRLLWRLGHFSPGQRQAVEFTLRAVQPGSAASCAEVTAAGGLHASDCTTTTTITGPAIDVRLSGPDQVAVGAEATFQIFITNRGQAAADGLMLKDRFPPGLEHAAAASPIEHSLNPLGPGQTQQQAVTFRVTRAGRLCHTVEIVNASGVVASAEGCVIGVEGPGTPPPVSPTPPERAERPRLSVRQTGPAHGTVGELVQFSIFVANRGHEPLTGVRVVVHADAGLKVTRASEGARRENGGLVWSIPSLPPGERETELAVEYECQTPARRLCNHVRVTSREGGRDEAEACIEVRERPATAVPDLRVTVPGLYQQITVGKEMTYEIRVKNQGLAPVRQVVLAATVPNGMVLVPLSTGGPTKFSDENGVVRFEPTGEIGPGRTAIYRIRVRTRQPGRFHFFVDVNCPGLPQPLHAEETTEVYPPAS